MLASLPAAAQSSEYIVIDAGKDHVLRYEASTGVFLNELIPPGSGGLNTAQGITVGPDSNLYVSSWATGSIKRYDRTTGAYLGDFVTPGSGGLSNPDQVIFGPDGNLYVSDRFSARVLRYDGKTGASLGTFVNDARLGGFVAFTFGPDGRLYASMFNGNPQCILRFDGMTGTFVDVFACAPDSSSAFSGLAFGSDGRLYASRYHRGEVSQLDGSSGKLLGTLHCPGDNNADYLGFGPDGLLYVSNLSPKNASRFDVHTGQCLGSYPVGGKISFGKGFVFFPALGADLFLRVTPSTTTVHQGDLLTYAFPVWNLGPSNAALEVLNTQVPAGTTFDYIRISGTPGLGTCTHPRFLGTGQIICHENSSMRSNSTWTVRLTVKVTAPSGTVITESAAAMADTPDPNLANNTATVSIKVQ
jgi:outer membrane protein assembly factor BamB